MDNKNLNRFSNLLFHLSILSFIIAFNFAHNPSAPWNYQSIPFLNNRVIADITFLDSLTGYAVTGDQQSGNDTDYVLKTTDGGYNWSINLARVLDFQRVIFINNDTGFVLHGDQILRTTNAALSWNSMPVPPDNFGFYDMFPISWDTMWVCFPYIGGDFLYRTTNAGFTWTFQLQNSSIQKIYMYNGRFGYVGAKDNLQNLLKTTNSGFNWQIVSGQTGFKEMFFLDSLQGWKTTNIMKRTTNGGISWFNISMPTSGLIINSSCQDFAVINKDTLWGVGGVIRYPNNQFRGILYRSSDQGNTWQYQIPDTSIRIFQYYYANFINNNVGWMYSMTLDGIQTTIGGDTNFITNVNGDIELISKDFKLNQNFPNPFNPSTLLRYELKRSAKVKLIVYNILGSTISTLIDKKQNAGNYQIKFHAGDLPTGNYFYSLLTDDNLIDTKQMLYLK